jgi:hypothetical protein
MNSDRIRKIFIPNPTVCWQWTGHIQKNGYGTFWNGRVKIYAHQYSYKVYKGSLPAGLEPDHLCRNRACVNPDHLEAVTHLVNIRRGIGGTINRSKTHCPKGHPYTPENTILRHGSRFCKTCHYAWEKLNYSPTKRREKYLRMLSRRREKKL